LTKPCNDQHFYDNHETVRVVPIYMLKHFIERSID